MSEGFVGEIRMFAGNFPPRNWAMCNGQFLMVDKYEPLFALIGTTYGGNGRSDFALPDMRGRVPLHHGQGPGLRPRLPGQRLGQELEILELHQIPSHKHDFMASQHEGNNNVPTASVFGSQPDGDAIYVDAQNVDDTIEFHESVNGIQGGRPGTFEYDANTVPVFHHRLDGRVPIKKLKETVLWLKHFSAK